MTIEQLIFF